MKEQELSGLSKRKKGVLKIAISLLIFLLICTFVSKSISTMLLPVVETASPTTSVLTNTLNEPGKVSYTNLDNVRAVGNMKIQQLFVSDEQIVKAGDKLFTVDVSDANIQKKRLQLAVLQLQSQLTPSKLSPAEKAEIELQLKIAKMEYELYQLNADLEFAATADKENISYAKMKEQSEETQTQLNLALNQYERYQIDGDGYNRSQEIQLRKTIASIERKLKKTDLSEDERSKLESELAETQYELDALTSAYPMYDPVTAQQYRLSVIQAQNRVLLLNEDISDDEKNSVQLEYELAQRDFEQYLQINDVKNEISAEKLNLDILRYENMLSPNSMTNEQKSAINLSIDIAKEELENFQKRMPIDGVIRADGNYRITKVMFEKGDIVSDGAIMFTYVTADSVPSIVWETSYEAGISYVPKSEIVAKFNKDGEDTTLNSLKVTNKKIIEETNRWEFTASFAENDVPVTVGTIVTVSISNKSVFYSNIVPLSCLHQQQDGTYTVNIIEQRKGLFSEENVVSEVPVKLEDKNNLYAAIEGDGIYNNMKIVKYTSKPLRNGSTVTVQN